MELRKILDISREEGTIIARPVEEMDFGKAIKSLIGFHNSYIRKENEPKIGKGVEIVVIDGNGPEGYTLDKGNVKKVNYDIPTGDCFSSGYSLGDVTRGKIGKGERLKVVRIDSYEEF